MKAVILAAGLGTRLEPYTRDLPKVMVPIAGTPLIDRMIERIGQAGIDEVIVVTGYMHEKLVRHLGESSHDLAQAATVVFNERFSDWGNFNSLLVAEEATGGDSFIKLDGDVLLAPAMLPALIAGPGALCLAMDIKEDLGDEEMKARVDGSGRIVELNKSIAPSMALGESVGVDRIDAAISVDVFAALRELIDIGETHEYYERAYELLIQRGASVGYADISACEWSEIDTVEDLRAAEAMLAGSSR